MAGTKVPLLVEIYFLAVLAKLSEKFEVLHDLSQLRNSFELDATLHLLLKVIPESVGKFFDE